MPILVRHGESRWNLSNRFFHAVPDLLILLNAARLVKFRPAMEPNLSE